MALADILAAMEAEAEAEIKRLEAQTAEAAAKTRAAAEADAHTIRERHRREMAVPLQQERARRLNRARLASLRATSRAREKLFAEAIACAREQLANLRRDACYGEILSMLVRETLTQLEGEIIVRADPRDEKVLRALLPSARLELDLRTWGGIEGHTGDGQIIVTNTLEARLEQALEQLRQEIMPLFGMPELSAPGKAEDQHAA